jgi:hypothetical protein
MALPHRLAACLPLLAACLAQPAAAETVRLNYEVNAAGMTVAEVAAQFDLTQPGSYQVELHLRTRGVAGFFVSGEQLTQASGAFAADAARPRRYAMNGQWRGEPRHILLEYEGGEPLVRRLEPPNDEEREPVPPELARGTVDALSALAQLTRRVATSGDCAAQAAVYDGRRRTDFTARTQGWEKLPERRGVWSGPALRCDFTGHQRAGFRRNEDRDARKPQLGRAWLARLAPDSVPVPVRVEMQSNWFGTVTVLLVNWQRQP